MLQRIPFSSRKKFSSDSERYVEPSVNPNIKIFLLQSNKQYRLRCGATIHRRYVYLRRAQTWYSTGSEFFNLLTI